MQRMLTLAVLLSAGAGCTASSSSSLKPPSSPPPSTSSSTPPPSPSPATGSAMPDPTLEEAPPAGPWSIVVLDGSANRFSLAAQEGVVRHAYAPVTPAMSSSGVYSGGAPKAGVVDAASATRLWGLARAALLDEGRHAPARAMGTVVVRIEVGAASREAIVKMGGADELLAALRALP